MGPNGAGKSTFGYLYTHGVQVYDPDKRKMEIETFFRSLSPSQLKAMYPSYTNDMFEDRLEIIIDEYKNLEYLKLRNYCIDHSLDFALETPFADNFGLNEIQVFKSKGYLIKGILFGLNSVEESISNVALRVDKGGHDLYLKSIEWNFIHSYMNIYKSMDLFDDIIFLHSFSVSESPSLFAMYSNGAFSYVPMLDTRPFWFNYFTPSTDLANI